MDKIKFNLLRDELFVEISSINDESKLTEEFKIKFFKLIESCTFSMMNGSDNFFSLFLIQLKREIRLDMPSATGTTMTREGFVIYFNPAIFLECTILEMQALIKHEIYHIMSRHHIRAKALKENYSSLAINLAMDISINQYIINLPVWMDTVERVEKSYDVDLEEDMTIEQYAEIIQVALNKKPRKKNSSKGNNGELLEEDYIKREHDVEISHEVWDSNNSFDNQMLKETAKKLALNADKGKLSSSIEELMRELNRKPEITWRDYLKRLLGTLPSGHKKTITRRDRRQPERMDLRGRLSRHIAEIVVAIDISGSITDKEIEQIMSEVFAVVKNYPSEVTIVECDSEIRRTYKVRNIHQVKKKVNTRGSTRFSSVFEYMANNRMKNHVLIYFTDGLGEEELSLKPIHRNTIWVLTGKEDELSLKQNYGVVKKLSNTMVKEAEYEYAPNAIKEYRQLEWSMF
jgi:predicted metal-dependent peptidase